jgi:hypothetical protein
MPRERKGEQRPRPFMSPREAFGGKAARTGQSNENEFQSQTNIFDLFTPLIHPPISQLQNIQQKNFFAYLFLGLLQTFFSLNEKKERFRALANIY